MSVRLKACSSEKLFYVRSDIPAKFGMFLVSSVSVDQILVLVVYRPPRSAHYGSLLDSVNEYIGIAPRVVSTGDFNYNLCDPMSVGQQFVHSIRSLNLIFVSCVLDKRFFTILDF